MTRRRALLALPGLAAALAGCGGDDGRPKPGPPTITTAAAAKLPPLARKPLESGELVFSGQSSPTSHGAFPLKGRYVVRFEQFASEDPHVDFAKETAFTARLRPASSTQSGVKLFGAAAASGRTEITRRGRYDLDVTYGDFPYAVRFTPAR